MAGLPPTADDALLLVFIFLAVAELLHSIADKVGFPHLVSDLLLGIVLSSYALGGVFNALLGVPIFVVSSYVLIFADFSVILLLFAAGLGGGFTGLRNAGRYAILAAVAGDLVPFALAYLLLVHVYSSSAALLLAVATAATSSAVVAALLQAQGVGDRPAGHFHMNVAALDDVVALVLLSVVLTVVGGKFDVLAATGSVLELVVAWVVLLLAAVLVFPRVVRLPALREARGLPFLFLFVLVVVVVSLGFSAVIGAYIAGLAVAESLVASRTREITEILLVLFGSLFFVVTGAQFAVGSLLNPALVALAVVLAGIAAFGKFVGVYAFARPRWDPETSRAVAFGMIPRGEIGLIVGSIGITSGLLDQTMLGEIVLMSIVTTLIGAVLFRFSASAYAGPASRPAGPAKSARPLVPPPGA